MKNIFRLVTFLSLALTGAFGQVYNNPTFTGTVTFNQSNSGGSAILPPALLGIGYPSSNNFLRGDGRWMSFPNNFGPTAAVIFGSAQLGPAANGVWALAAYGSLTTGQSYGELLAAGTNSSDTTLLVQNASASTTYMKIRGDGQITLGSGTGVAVLTSGVLSAMSGSANTFLGYNGGGVLGFYTGGSGSGNITGATPTVQYDLMVWGNTVGTSAIDPAQSTVNIWQMDPGTGDLVGTVPGSASSNFVLKLTELTAATNGNPKWSPAIDFDAHYYSTGSKLSEWRIEDQTGANSYLGNLTFSNALNGGSFIPILTLSTTTGGGGTSYVSVPGELNVTGEAFVGNLNIGSLSGTQIVQANSGTASGFAFTTGNNGQVLGVSAGALAWVSPLSNPMTTTGDIIYATSGATPGRLGIGSANQVLTVISGIPSWQNASSGFANPMTTAGDLILGGSGGSATRLGIGSNTFVLTSNGTTASWAAAASSGVPSVTGTAGNILINGGTIAVTSAATFTLPTAITSINSITAAASNDLNLSPASGNNLKLNTTSGGATYIVNSAASSGLGIQSTAAVSTSNLTKIVSYLNDSGGNTAVSLIQTGITNTTLGSDVTYLGFSTLANSSTLSEGMRLTGSTLSLNNLSAYSGSDLTLTGAVHVYLVGATSSPAFAGVVQNTATVSTSNTAILQFQLNDSVGESNAGFITGGFTATTHGSANGYLAFSTQIAGSSTEGFRLSGAGNVLINMTADTGLSGAGGLNVNGEIRTQPTWTNSSGSTVTAALTQTLNQTSTGGNTLLRLVSTDTALGSGAQLVLDIQAGSSPSSVFTVDHSGNFISHGTATLTPMSTAGIVTNNSSGVLASLSNASSVNSTLMGILGTGWSNSSTLYLAANGTWGTPAGSGGISGLTNTQVVVATGSTTIGGSANFTWASPVLTLTNSALGATATDSLLLTNTTAATNGTQQDSPLLHFHGLGWGTTAGTSQSVDWAMGLRPVQSTVPTSVFALSAAVAGGGYSDIFTISTAAAGSFSFVPGGGVFLISGGSANNTVLVGRGTSSAAFSTIVGDGATGSGGQSTAMGASASATTNSDAYGYGATTTAQGQFVVSTFSSGITDVFFNKGVTSASAGNWTLHGTGGSGSNNVAGNVYLAAGQSTGNAVPATVNLQVGTTTSSGSTVQTLFTGLTMTGDSGTSAGATGFITNFFTLDAGSGTGASVILGGESITKSLRVGTKIASYNAVATTGGGVPAIYGSGRQTAQVAADTSVATYTVGASDGSFDIESNVLVTAATTASFTVTCTYTDEGNTSRTLTLTYSQISGVLLTTITNVTGTGAYEGVPLHIRAKASTAITIATTGTFTSVTYNIEANIIQTN